jgi:N-acetylmuramoyl-L-alanine amidase
LLFSRLYKTIRFLHLLGRNKPVLQLPEATIFFVSGNGTPFSFFKNIYWGEEMDIDSVASRQILRHEIFHVINHHTLDILFLEFMSILCWFNPFYHLTGRELRATHEYAADAYAASGADRFEYANLLLRKGSGSSVFIAHPFFKNQIKRRIHMITKIRKNKKMLAGRLMSLPLLLVLIGLFSFKIQNHIHWSASKSLRVVIDAGHGGSFTGAESNGVYEKSINLDISKKIQALSKEYNVEVIMTRETDITPGSNELRESLEYIAALPKNKNADLFISIHANVTENAQAGKMQTAKSGFQIYIPWNTSDVYENSLKLGSIMTEVIKSDYKIESQLKQSKDDGGNILVLKKATVPAILIECGYMDNPEDQKYLQDEKNQEKIARDILEGIRKYGLQNTPE